LSVNLPPPLQRELLYMTLYHITYSRFPSHSLILAVLEFTTAL
jgi:hypothetical protein